MLKITVIVACPPGQAIGVKEAIAMDLEKYGDTKVTNIEVIEPEQLRLELENGYVPNSGTGRRPQ